jgi:hypothetical protein
MRTGLHNPLKQAQRLRRGRRQRCRRPRRRCRRRRRRPGSPLVLSSRPPHRHRDSPRASTAWSGRCFHQPPPTTSPTPDTHFEPSFLEFNGQLWSGESDICLALSTGTGTRGDLLTLLPAASSIHNTPASPASRIQHSREPAAGRYTPAPLQHLQVTAPSLGRPHTRVALRHNRPVRSDDRAATT